MIKRTIVKPDDTYEQYNRKGFAPVCCYGSMKVEPNEIGGIFIHFRNTRPTPSGLYETDVECVERIFVGD